MSAQPINSINSTLVKRHESLRETAIVAKVCALFALIIVIVPSVLNMYGIVNDFEHQILLYTGTGLFAASLILETKRHCMSRNLAKVLKAASEKRSQSDNAESNKTISVPITNAPATNASDRSLKNNVPSAPKSTTRSKTRSTTSSAPATKDGTEIISLQKYLQEALEHTSFTEFQNSFPSGEFNPDNQKIYADCLTQALNANKVEHALVIVKANVIKDQMLLNEVLNIATQRNQPTIVLAVQEAIQEVIKNPVAPQTKKNASTSKPSVSRAPLLPPPRLTTRNGTQVMLYGILHKALENPNTSELQHLLPKDRVSKNVQFDWARCLISALRDNKVTHALVITNANVIKDPRLLGEALQYQFNEGNNSIS